MPDSMTATSVGSKDPRAKPDKHKKSWTLDALAIPEMAKPAANMAPEIAAPNVLRSSFIPSSALLSNNWERFLALQAGAVKAANTETAMHSPLPTADMVGFLVVRNTCVMALQDRSGDIKNRVNMEIPVKVHVATKLRRLNREIPQMPCPIDIYVHACMCTYMCVCVSCVEIR